MHVPSPSKRQIIVGATLALAALASLRLFNRRTRPPEVFQWECGNSPNCASSRDPRPDFHFAPLPLQTSPTHALQRARSIASSLPRWHLVSQIDSTLQFQVSSRVFGFVDDITLEVDPKDNSLHLRSASRVGYSDLGQNRRHLEAFAEQWNRPITP